MVKKYVKKKLPRKGYSYTKNGKRIKVPPGKQRYKVKNPALKQRISLEEAKKIHEQRSQRAQTIDEKTTAKNLKEEPDLDWKYFPGRSDVQGIDDLSNEGITNVKARQKGQDLVEKLLEEEETSLTSSNAYPGWVNLQKMVRSREIVLTSEDIDRLEEHFGDQHTLRKLRREVEGLEEIKNLKRRKKMTEDPKEMTIKKLNEETYQVLRNTLGSGDPQTSEEILDAYIKSMAKITGPDRQYGLSRSWLGERDWDTRKTEYTPEELDRLEEGAIIERNTRYGREHYRKVDGEWYLIAEQKDGVYNLKGIIPTAAGSADDQRKLEAIVEHSDDLSARMLAIEDVNDKELLENIAVSDESYRMRSKAYHRIKELDPNDYRLEELRNYYEQASKRQAEQRIDSDEASSKITRSIRFNDWTGATKAQVDKVIDEADKITETSHIRLTVKTLARNTENIPKEHRKRLANTLLNNITRKIDEQALLNDLKRDYPTFYKEITEKR